VAVLHELIQRGQTAMLGTGATAMGPWGVGFSDFFLGEKHREKQPV